MAKLKLVWENNPDTPLSAVNLSKFVNYSTDEGRRILYVDEPSVYPNGDGKLKIRSNSRVSFVVPNTNAFFRFNDSLVSHNSKYIPSTAINLNYRLESAYLNSKSLAIDEASSNLIALSGTWTNNENGSSSVSSYSGVDPIENGDFRTFTVDSSGSRVETYTTVSFTSNETVSISFYYKGEGLSLIIEGDPGGTIKNWKDELLTQAWVSSPPEFIYSLPTVTEWTRFQLDNIDTTFLSSNEIRVILYSTIADAVIDFGALQFEELNYSSSFMISGASRVVSQLIFPSDIIDIEEGCIDITFRVESFENDNIIFVARTISDDALKLYFDILNEKIVFEVYDTGTPSIIKTELPVSFINIRNDFIRVIVNWKSSFGVKITTEISNIAQTSTNANTFVPFLADEITETQLGGEYNGASSSNLLRGMIDSLKFNFLFKSAQQIEEDLLVVPYPEANDYKFFEVESENIFLDENYLDFGTSFDALTKYFVWICDDRNEDTATILISKSNFEPVGFKRYFSVILGSFETTAGAEFDAFSVWDVSTYFTNNIHTNRFVIGGINSATPDIEFRKIPFGPSNDATFNVPTYYTDHIYSGTFMDIDPSGIFNFDNVRIDGSEITSINLNSDLTLTANGNGSVVIDSTNIEFVSGAGSIQLDEVRVKNNKVYAANGYDLIIRNDEATSNLILEAVAGTVQINAQDIDLNAGSGSITFDQVRIEQDTISNPSSDLIITALDDIELQSGSGEIHIDDLKIKDNLLFNDIGDVDIEAIGFDVNITGNNINFNAAPGGLGLENIEINNNILSSESGFDLIIKTSNSADDVLINSPGTGSIYINAVKFDSNKIYSDSGTDLIINSSSASSDVVFTGNRILFETSLTMDDENIRFKDSNLGFTNAQGHTSGRGVNVYPEAATATGNAVFTVSNNSLAKQFEVLEGDGVRIGTSGILQSGQSTPTGTDVLGYNGYFYANKVYNAVYNDLAECWQKEKGVEIDYGQVVVRNHSRGVELSTKRAQLNVVGVASKDFGYLLGSEEYIEDLKLSPKVPIAISGRVRVKIRLEDVKKLKYGDELVSYKGGIATKANWFERVFKRAAIIGKFDAAIGSEALIKVF